MWGQRDAYIFSEGAEHPVWVPSQFVKPHGPPGPEDEEAVTGDSPQDRELWRLILPPTRWKTRKWLLARQMQYSEPPT
jgi:hypothetical protein